eukprot:CAMPEP_0174384330 /NCGR_PEP_ID=MMETSP0811_2-20130205/125844_1 /TAXON_ID=73025 ORGANISM="Eutreptiella gymnastica-like, Strain CCMP1594" /NCGR_SAMPLE_ID=MMETSP0811_2 /ASSEMBLY_ACC=CAM_ASM_000667 /LENGTH=109 /DNA_ID=CAMNT_0015538245 /DNA_START=124 /DNA_END=454 /DNA_ORIENTATION=+
MPYGGMPYGALWPSQPEAQRQCHEGEGGRAAKVVVAFLVSGLAKLLGSLVFCNKVLHWLIKVESGCCAWSLLWKNEEHTDPFLEMGGSYDFVESELNKDTTEGKPSVAL